VKGKFRKAIISLTISASLSDSSSVLIERTGSHGKYRVIKSLCAPDDYYTYVRCTENFWLPCIFKKVDTWIFFEKSDHKIQVSFKSDRNNGYFAWDQHTFMTIYLWILFRMRNFSDKVVYMFSSKIENAHWEEKKKPQRVVALEKQPQRENLSCGSYSEDSQGFGLKVTCKLWARRWPDLT